MKKKSGILKELKKRFTLKKILKKEKPVLVIKKFEPAPYVSRYFKNEWDETKRQMFFG